MISWTMEKADPQKKIFSSTFAINFVCGTVNLSDNEQKQSFKKFIGECKKKKKYKRVPTENEGGGGSNTKIEN